MYYVYILLCEDNTLYTGISHDPQARFQRHLSGRGAAYTRSHKPVRLLYTEQQLSLSAALKREKEIKSWDRKTKITTFKLVL